MDSSVLLTHVLALKSSTTLHRSTFFSTTTRSNSSSLSPSPSPSALRATVKTSRCLFRQPVKTAQRNVQRPVKPVQRNVLPSTSTCLLRQPVQSSKLNVKPVPVFSQTHVAPVNAILRICSKSYPNETEFNPVQLAAQLARGPLHHRLSRHRLRIRAPYRHPRIVLCPGCRPMPSSTSPPSSLAKICPLPPSTHGPYEPKIMSMIPPTKPAKSK
jgi:hypothetical protein